ncbi:MAG: hypothetical protein PHN31_02900 [Candidatus Gracilibacteria bacterium]|nr:hypothetical protein [Candidatus Gracilibacteria bacterium]
MEAGLFQKITLPEEFMLSRLEYDSVNSVGIDTRRKVKELLAMDNISLLTKYLVLKENLLGVIVAIDKLSREEKDNMLEELSMINVDNLLGRKWIYDNMVRLCSN